MPMEIQQPTDDRDWQCKPLNGNLGKILKLPLGHFPYILVSGFHA